MHFVHTNEQTLVIYLSEGDKLIDDSLFAEIEHLNKARINISYHWDSERVLQATEKKIRRLSHPQNRQEQYDNIVLMGEGYAADIANNIAHRQSLRAILFNPQFRKPFLTSNREDTFVLISNQDVAYQDKTQKHCANLPSHWQVEYSHTQHDRWLTFLPLLELCNDGFAWIDDATYYDED